jgi:transcription initiation factor TFIIH subunit 2
MSNNKNKNKNSADAQLDALDEDHQVNSNAGYSWEDSFKRSWDTIEEDENGILKPFVKNLKDMKKKRR